MRGWQGGSADLPRSLRCASLAQRCTEAWACSGTIMSGIARTCLVMGGPHAMGKFRAALEAYVDKNVEIIRDRCHQRMPSATETSCQSLSFLRNHSQEGAPPSGLHCPQLWTATSAEGESQCTIAALHSSATWLSDPQ